MNTGRKLFALGAFWAFLVTAGVLSVQAQIYSGRATGIRAAVTSNGTTNTTSVADTCPLSITGGSHIATTPVGFISGLARTGAITSSTSGAGLTSQSSSTVQDLNLSVGGYVIRATSVSSSAQCNCCVPNAPACSGRTTIVGLTVTDPTGTPVTAVPNGSANQTITLPNGAGSIIINEQVRPAGTTNVLDVNALRINITGANGVNSNVVVAGSHADIDCTVTSPTPGDVVVSGRVFDSTGRGLSRVTLTLTGSNGSAVTARTNLSGNFTFEGVEAGDTYVLQATHSQYSFAPVALNLTENVTVDLRPSSSGGLGLK